MPLYIKDDDVDRLAVEVQNLIGAPTKTEAVRQALEHEIARARAALPISARLASAVAKADAMGPGDPNFDMKQFTDEMWDM